MQDFLTGLQFLTRLRLVRQQDWSAESFGRSVKYFPLVGAVVGALLVALYYVLATFLPPHALAASLLLAGIMLTGGLHCDGLMDTMDGIFSGRERERMLEIMKDSRVGSNGVIAFAMTYIFKWSLLLDLTPALLPLALFTAPVAARLAMVIGVSLFPYARADGMGKAFAQYAGRSTLIIAALFTGLLLGPLGWPAAIGGGVAVLFALLFAAYVTKRLAGLTGDVYGALSELTEVVVLLLFCFWGTLSKLPELLASCR